MPKDVSSPLVLCFGEAVWDVFPDAMHPGGAPLNVAYHLSKLGCRAAPVTAIGKDALGIRLLDQMKAWGLETAFVTQNDLPTGLINVSLDNTGNATYEIVENAAWDRIALDDRQLEHAAGAAAVVFGTLALREDHNKAELPHLLARCAGALKVYDVNLRPPYTPSANVWPNAANANVIKLNTDELEELLRDAESSYDPGKTNTIEAAAREFCELTQCDSVCVTAAAAGAGLLYPDASADRPDRDTSSSRPHRTWHWEAARPVKVKDTVGAGDAFLAALTAALLSQTPTQLALEQACRLAEFVTTHTSATPEYTLSDLRQTSKRSAQP